MRAETVAVVGGGCAGLVTAYLLRRRYEVTVFEPADHLGGHAHTVTVPSGPDRGRPLDLGFMVMNPRTYPLFYRLLGELGVADLGPSEMSFAYWDPSADFQYALNWDLGGLGRGEAGSAPPPRELLAIVPGILRLQREAMRLLPDPPAGDFTLGRFITEREVPEAVAARYLVPMAAAIWSTDPVRMLEFPAASLFRFLDNHGLLSLDAPPRWQHVRGGSRRYVDALVAALPPGAVSRSRVRRVRRAGDGVLVATGEGERRFTRVVLACHADEARALLADAREDESAALSAWTYQRNLGVLHTDASVMPPRASAWASWNVRRDAETARLVTTYHLNRLQGYPDAREQYFLTLDPVPDLDASRVLGRVEFTHPTFGRGFAAAQETLRRAGESGRVAFCGSYMGYGFHEDAVRSAHDVARALGAEA